MEKTITSHLKKLNLKPRSDNFFKEVAEDLTGKTVDNPKEAKVIVRVKISEGQVTASNDNLSGLKAQVVSEQEGGGTSGYKRLAKAFMFKKPTYNEEKAEKYLDDRNIAYGRPVHTKKTILLPLDSISKDDTLASKRIDEHISILHCV